MTQNIETSYNFSSFIQDLESITTVKATSKYSPTTTAQYKSSVSSTIETHISYPYRNSMAQKVFPPSSELSVINNSSGNDQTEDNVCQ